MDAFLDKFFFLKSRKFWTMIGAVVTLLVTASNQDPYPIDTVIQGIVAIVLGYIGTTAWEDVAMKKAMMAPTTTVTTPGSSDVQVTALPDNVFVTPGATATQPLSGTFTGRHP